MTSLLLLLLVGQPEMLPAGLLYEPYFGAPKESRIADVKFWDPDRRLLWDITLGGRAGLLRLGTPTLSAQLDVEGAAFVRLDLDDSRDLLATEFKYGLWLTFQQGPLTARLGYYHLSSHLGDESFVWKSPNQYSRDAGAVGLSYRSDVGIRIYGELEVGVLVKGPAERVHLHFGASYSPVIARWWGAPYAALHAWMRQENRFNPTVTAQVGWLWRPTLGGHSYRIGLYYLGGPSPHYQFYDEVEHQLGFGNWFEF